MPGTEPPASCSKAAPGLIAILGSSEQPLHSCPQLPKQDCDRLWEIKEIFSENVKQHKIATSFPGACGERLAVPGVLVQGCTLPRSCPQKQEPSSSTQKPRAGALADRNHPTAPQHTPGEERQLWSCWQTLQLQEKANKEVPRLQRAVRSCSTHGSCSLQLLPQWCRNPDCPAGRDLTAGRFCITELLFLFKQEVHFSFWN